MENGFFDVPEWHPLFWDKEELPVDKCPVEFREKLKAMVADYNRNWNRNLAWMSENERNPSGKECKKERRKISIFLHPDKVSKKNPNFLDAANYFNLKIKEFAKMLEIGVDHIRAQASNGRERCPHCQIPEYCNEGVYLKKGELHLRHILDVNNQAHRYSESGKDQTIFDDTK